MDLTHRQLVSRTGMLLLAVSLFLVYVTANAPTTLYIVWQQQMGYTASGVTTIFIFYHLGIACALLGLAKVQRLATIKWILCAALVETLIAGWLFAHAQSFVLLVLARFIIGFGCGSFVRCGISLILKIGLKFQFTNTPLLITLACVMGFALGPFYAGVLADLTANPLQWIFYPPIAILVIVLALLSTRKTTLFTSDESIVTNSETHPVKKRPCNYPMAVAAIAMFAAPFTISGLFISLGPNMVSDLMHNHSRTMAGRIPLVLFGCGVISQIILRNRSVSSQAGLGLLLTFFGGIGVLMAEVSQWVSLMFVAAILAGIGQSLTQLASTTLIKQFIPLGTIERSTSALFLGGYLTAAALISLMGLVATHMGLLVGSQVFLYLCFMLMMVGGGAYIIAHRSGRDE